MKTPSLFCLLLALGLAIPTARAQFPNFPAADRVLGNTTFIGAGAGLNKPSGLGQPTSVTIDPVSGKLFVACQSQHRILRFPNAAALANGANAEAVFGQLNFSGDSPGFTATTLNVPYGVHVDGSGRLWVADYLNNRILMFEGAATLPGFGALPDLVLGQPDFTTVTDGATSSKMGGPTGVFVDDDDNLWVADFSNHRVLMFANASSLSNGAAATTVLGQPNFTTITPATTAVKMNNPNYVTVDAQGRLWVTEHNNLRVLRFDNAATLANGSAADGVLGQADFTSASTATTAQSISVAAGVVVDAVGTLYVSDFTNKRILIHKNAATKANGAAADGVIGQPDFTTNTLGATEKKIGGCYGGLALDANGALWVSDINNNRVLRFSPDRTATPPKLTGKVPKTTTAATLALRGTASDTSGVAKVKFRVGKGPIKNATGTTAWRLTARLKPGKNTIEITVTDRFGNTSAAKRVTVKRL